MTAVLTLGLVNFALGFALAIVCARLPMWGVPILQMAFPRESTATVRRGDTVQLATHDSSSTASTSQGDWSERLQTVEVKPASLLESLLWTAKIDTASFREQLLPFSGLRAVAAPPWDEFVALLQLRSAQLEEWLQVIYDNQSALPERHTSNLEELLLDQIFQAKASVDAVTQTPDESGPRQLVMVADATHAFRDHVDALLGVLLREEHRETTIPAPFRQSADNVTFTRLGLEVLFAEWLQRDPERMRLISATLVDLDRFGSLNQRLGMERADAVRDRCGDLLCDLIRQDRGFDRVAQISGQRFLILLGDTSAANALQGAERTRQTIEATSFGMGTERVELTASLSAAEWQPTEDIAAFLQRLEKCLAAAKQTGRNRVGVDNGSGPEFSEPPRYTVTSRTIEVVSEALAVS